MRRAGGAPEVPLAIGPALPPRPEGWGCAAPRGARAPPRGQAQQRPSVMIHPRVPTWSPGPRPGCLLGRVAVVILMSSNQGVSWVVRVGRRHRARQIRKSPGEGTPVELGQASTVLPLQD